MFFSQDERKNNPFSAKYKELNDTFLSFFDVSLDIANPVKLAWSTPSDINKPRVAYIKMHSKYHDLLENIDNFINDIKIERIQDRLSPAEKDKVIDAFIIPLYELKKTIYADVINSVHENVEKLQKRQNHPGRYKVMSTKYFYVEKECNRQIKNCNDSINEYKPTSCVNFCAIL